MPVRRIVLFLISNISIFTQLYAQTTFPISEFFTSGISVKAGVGYHTVKDEFISKEKYSGFSPMFLLDWSKYHETYGFDLYMEILSSAKIKNYSMPAKLTEFSLGINYLYSIGSSELLGKKIYLFLGPTPEVFFFFRDQNLAQGGETVFDAYSVTGMFSAGINFSALLPINNQWQLEGHMQSNVIAFGGKLKDFKNSSNSFVKFLTPFNEQRFIFDISANYKLTRSIQIKTGYRFNMTRITAWDYLISTGDNLTASVSFTL